MSKPVTAIIVGAGHRSVVYARYALDNPDKLKIVGVADPDAQRRAFIQKYFDLKDDMLFESADALAAKGRLADAVINGTMDQQHVKTSLPLLAQGYDMLLEKPFAVNEEELRALMAAVRKYKNRVMICHVLRYAPFYEEIKLRTAEIGKIMTIQTTECVSHDHMLIAYVRGKWRNTACAGHHSMLLAKSCHDVDLVMWMKSGIAPVKVSSFGGMQQFRPENAPKGCGERCLVDCPKEIEDNCIFSARKQYLEHPDRWRFYVWRDLEGIDNPTLEQKEALLKTSDYGRCAYKMDTEVVDNQMTLVEFEDGCVATHAMISGTPFDERTIRITGERGEITGSMNTGIVTVRVLDPHIHEGYREETINTRDKHREGDGGGHGGGDERLVADFVAVLRGEKPSVSCTDIEDSVAGHMTVFRADRAMETGSVQDIPRV